MSLKDVSETFKSMPAEDRRALQELKAEEIKRTGHDVTIGDIIRAVTPGLPDPEYLKG